ncbi:MAG: sigma 54-interacting transcriptional regulator [Polyangiaceae bacterium]
MAKSEEPHAREGATTSVERRTSPVRSRVVVRVTGAPATPNPMTLGEGAAVLGAGAKADLIIDSDSVSRAHAELTVTPDGVLVRDLGSRNGTFFEGQRIGTLTVAPGSRIVLGSVDVYLMPDLEGVEALEVTHYRGLLGSSAEMRKLFGVLTQLEGSLVNVLVLGESGVGKEVVARAIHEGSRVRSGPLVVKNCAAMSRELVLSELFGHKKGAFTGALDNRVGAFEAADGGTLFLDEVGELPLEVQPMLLRALETGEVVPVGENKPRKARVRLVAATNRNLAAMMVQGTFREDLYYRLAVVSLTVPPLRARPDDIEMLARHFARDAGLADLPGAVLQALSKRAFPGNVRELRNVILAYSALGVLPEEGAPRGDVLGMGLRSQVRFDVPFGELRDELEARFTKEYLKELMQRVGSNQSEAARVSGIERSHLRKLLGRYGLLKMD